MAGINEDLRTAYNQGIGPSSIDRGMQDLMRAAELGANDSGPESISQNGFGVTVGPTGKSFKSNGIRSLYTEQELNQLMAQPGNAAMLNNADRSLKQSGVMRSREDNIMLRERQQQNQALAGGVKGAGSGPQGSSPEGESRGVRLINQVRDAGMIDPRTESGRGGLSVFEARDRKAFADTFDAYGLGNFDPSEWSDEDLNDLQAASRMAGNAFRKDEMEGLLTSISKRLEQGKTDKANTIKLAEQEGKYAKALSSLEESKLLQEAAKTGDYSKYDEYKASRREAELKGTPEEKRLQMAEEERIQRQENLDRAYKLDEQQLKLRREALEKDEIFQQERWDWTKKQAETEAQTRERENALRSSDRNLSRASQDYRSAYDDYTKAIETGDPKSSAIAEKVLMDSYKRLEEEMTYGDILSAGGSIADAKRGIEAMRAITKRNGFDPFARGSMEDARAVAIQIANESSKSKGGISATDKAAATEEAAQTPSDATGSGITPTLDESVTEYNETEFAAAIENVGRLDPKGPQNINAPSSRSAVYTSLYDQYRDTYSSDESFNAFFDKVVAESISNEEAKLAEANKRIEALGRQGRRPSADNRKKVEEMKHKINWLKNQKKTRSY